MLLLGQEVIEGNKGSGYLPHFAKSRMGQLCPLVAEFINCTHLGQGIWIKIEDCQNNGNQKKKKEKKMTVN